MKQEFDCDDGFDAARFAYEEAGIQDETGVTYEEMLAQRGFTCFGCGEEYEPSARHTGSGHPLCIGCYIEMMIAASESIYHGEP